MHDSTAHRCTLFLGMTVCTDVLPQGDAAWPFPSRTDCQNTQTSGCHREEIVLKQNLVSPQASIALAFCSGTQLLSMTNLRPRTVRQFVLTPKKIYPNPQRRSCWKIAQCIHAHDSQRVNNSIRFTWYHAGNAYSSLPLEAPWNTATFW